MSIGLFALFSLPLGQEEHDSIGEAVSELLHSPKVIMHGKSPGISIEYSLRRKESNLLQTFLLHFSVDNLLSVFKHLKRAPTRFSEIAIDTRAECSNQKQFRIHMHFEPDDHSELLQ
jgi:hypothetical protein